MRARNIKPGFFRNEELGEQSPYVRLLFAGLWCMADREGRLKYKPKRIKADIFPYDDISQRDIHRYLTVISRLNNATFYVVNGETYIQINNWHVHQRPHHTEKKSDIPPLSQADKILELNEEKEITVNSPLSNGEYPPDSLIPDSLIPDSKQTNVCLTPLSKKTEKQDLKKRKTSMRPEFVPPDDWLDFAIKKGLAPGDAGAEFGKFKDHHMAKGSLMLNWDAAWRTWIRNSIEFKQKTRRFT
jgi:hypothetical protein